MANSSILGGERAPAHPPGKGTDRLGPSDSSDSGSDAQGELSEAALASDSDRAGTGERASADPRDSGAAADVRPDHLETDPDDALASADVSLDDASAEVSELAVEEDEDVSDEE